LVLLVQHGHGAFPALRRVPRTDRIIFGFVGFATTDTNEHTTKQKEQKPSHRRHFMSGGRMRRADLIAFNHFAEFPTGTTLAMQRFFSRLRTTILATSLPSG